MGKVVTLDGVLTSDIQPFNMKHNIDGVFDA